MIPSKYNIRFFEVIHDGLNVYPCKFHNILSENRYDCENKEQLKEIIEKEIAHPKTKLTLTKLLYHFYDKETIEKLIIS
jgi:hypothetical protein